MIDQVDFKGVEAMIKALPSLYVCQIMFHLICANVMDINAGGWLYFP